MRCKQLSWLAGALLASAATSTAQIDRAVFLLDRTGSMTLGATATTPNRCDKSMAQCKVDIDNFFLAHPAGETMVREFSGDIMPGGVRTLGGMMWHTNATSARNAVDTAMPCTGLTPLAAALCDTGNAVLLSGAADSIRYYIYSDGGDNLQFGACTGLPATNATTGACSFDQFGGPDYSPGADGNPSWQQQACQSLEFIKTFFPVAIFSTYKFDDFATDGGSISVFRFLDSVARGSGGVSLPVDDSVAVPPSIQSRPTGCGQGGIAEPILQFQGQPRIGETFTAILSAPAGYDRFIRLGVVPYTPPLDLSLIQAPGCGLGVRSAFTIRSGLLPFAIPNNPALVGQVAHYQGLAIDLTAPFAPGWLLTTNSFAWELLDSPNVPPTVTITNPSTDLLGINGLGWDGFDTTRGQWFNDVLLQASASDDDPIPSGNIVWRTSRTDLQGAVLGTGTAINARFYGNNATNEIHTITLTVTDVDGAQAAAVRQIRFWTIL